MMVELPTGFFMEEQIFPERENSINKTMQKIQKIAKQGLPTDALVIQLRKTESLSSQERQQIALSRNQMEEDPFPSYVLTNLCVEILQRSFMRCCN